MMLTIVTTYYRNGDHWLNGRTSHQWDTDEMLRNWRWGDHWRVVYPEDAAYWKVELWSAMRYY